MKINPSSDWSINAPEVVNVTQGSISDHWRLMAPEAPMTYGLSGTQRAGLILAASVLFIIFLVFVSFFALIVNSEINPSIVDFSSLKDAISNSLVKLQNSCSSENYNSLKDLIVTLVDVHKSNRDFLMSVGQFALTTVLLPVLMALLGYIFGSNKS